jgi:Ca2+-binding EF-hand superfamily protein
MATEADWKETWYLFDDKKTDKVPKSDFVHIIRALGRKHTEAEIAEICKDLSDPVSLDEFLKYMRTPYNGPTQQDLMQALQAFDGNDSGFLKQTELVSLLTTLGEKMTEEEVQQVMKDAPMEDDKINIEQFAKYLCTPVPSMTPNIEELQKQLAA